MEMNFFAEMGIFGNFLEILKRITDFDTFFILTIVQYQWTTPRHTLGGGRKEQVKWQHQ